MLTTWRIKHYGIIGCFTLILSVSGNVDTALADLTVHEIPPLGVMESSKAYGINNAGVVCGKSYTTDDDDKAMTWTVGGGGVELPSLGTDTESGTWDINDSGQVSGFSRTDSNNRHGVRWNSNLSIVDLGTLENQTTHATGDESAAYGINTNGDVFGYAEIPNDEGDFTPFHAVVYSDGNGLEDLGTLNTTVPEYQYGYSIAYSSNSTGSMIVGITYTNSSNYKPFIYENDTMAELPVDATYEAGEWYATVVNDSDMIGGHVIVSGEGTFPYYWDEKSSTPVGITMPVDFPNGEIYGINAAGLMVGIMWNGDGSVEHAFVFDKDRGVRDLNDLIGTSGWVLNYAREINDNGQVVGAGTLSSAIRGYMLEGVAIPGDINGDTTIDLEDTITALKVVSGLAVSASADADLNGDGVIGVAEAIATLQILATP